MNQTEPEIIETAPSSNSTISNITDDSEAPRTPVSLPTQRIETGLPQSPMKRSIILPSDEAMEEGYDSDGMMGPFFDPYNKEEEDAAMDEVPVVVPVETRQAQEPPSMTEDSIKKMKVGELRDSLRRRVLATNGLKADLAKRLLEAVKVGVPVQDLPVEQVENGAGAAFAVGAYWKVLEQNSAELPDLDRKGFRFREPTVPESEDVRREARVKKKNYDATFDRSPFVGTTLLPERKPNGKLRRDAQGTYTYKKMVSTKTGPNMEYIFKAGLDFESHPAEWFELFLPFNRKKNMDPKAITFEEFTAWLNTKAMMANAGSRGGRYKNFVDFKMNECRSHLALYLLHAISPSPQVEMKFKSSLEDPVNGNDICSQVFGKGGNTRHKEFKAFFSACDPVTPTPSTVTHPNWKIHPCLRHMMAVSKQAIFIGQDISIDEQDISFQGRHKDKQRVTYKRAGDGFLVDALCSDGYTYSWYFRNEPAPKSWLDKGLSPLHSRVMILLQQLPEGTKNYVCGMDNLFMSPKFAKIAHNESGRKVMIHGVCRQSRGIPNCILQDAVTKKDDLLRTRGTVKASVLQGDPSCPSLVALSFYDTKPVYFVSNACKNITWMKKDRQLWHAEKHKKMDAPFYRLNLVNEYNLGMGNVDQADQLRLQYRIHYWLRNRKWWWAIFFWIFELSLTNCFVLYHMFHEAHDRSLPMNHYEFIKAVALAWLDPDTYWPAQKKKTSRSVSSSTTATPKTGISTRRSLKIQPKKSASVTDKYLDPYTGVLRCRLNTSLCHLPEENKKNEANCQLCNWAIKKKNRSRLMTCPTCNIILCLTCYKKFHLVADLNVFKNGGGVGVM